jgi:hypothetical protein
VGLEEHGLMEILSSGRDRRIETLQMSHLNDAAVPGGQLKNPVGIGEIRSERLFNQKVDSRSQQGLGSRGMMHRRHTHGCSINLSNRSQTGLDGLEGGDLELCGSGGKRSRIAVHNSDKLDMLTGLLQFAIDTQMVAPEGARANNDNPQWRRSRHYFVLTGASTAWRQRAYSSSSCVT